MSGDTNEKDYKGRHLTGKGGIGLVMFHLAKRQIEFALTWDNCRHGDVWIVANGARLTIEVKTCRKGQKWQISKRQVGSSDLYALVSMENAACYIVTDNEMREAVRASSLVYDGVAVLSDRELPRDSLHGWHRITQKQERAPRSPIVYKSERVVRRTLADGSIKEYRYPPYAVRSAAAA